MSKGAKFPNPADAAIAGIQADTELQPFNYLINAAANLGKKVTIDGRDYDFTGQGQADTAAVVSDQMAQTLLDLQTERSPEIIAQRLAELKAADPKGYAARQQLFDRIMADSQSHPGSPVASDLQQTLQDELAKGGGFSDAKQEEQVREGVRGGQVGRGVYLGAAPASEEAKTVVNAGETLRDQRQQAALGLLESGASPDDVAYRQFQQSLGNLANFTAGRTPTAQFREVSSSGNGPVPFVGGAPNTNTFNPNAAGQGIQNATGIYNAQANFNNSQANPWLAGFGIATSAANAVYKTQNP